MPVVLTALVFAASCKDKGGIERGAEVGASAAEPGPQMVVPVGEEPQQAPELRNFAHAGDEVAALARLGSLPAWSAVTERYRLLSRRSQMGAVHGRVLEHEQEGLLRLVDDTIGQGALSIPISLPEGLVIEPETRAVLWGAWELDGAEQGNGRQWLWRVTRAERLEDEPGPPFSPGMHARVQEPPSDLVPASEASRRGGPIAFTVLEGSERVGDGWLIADPGTAGPGKAGRGKAAAGKAGSDRADPVARLLLLGEIESYGAQSSPSASERWQLEPGAQYWLEIGRFRPASGGSLPVYQARSLVFQRQLEPVPTGGPESEKGPRDSDHQ